MREIMRRSLAIHARRGEDTAPYLANAGVAPVSPREWRQPPRFAANCFASRIAAIMLEGFAIPLPAMS
jgi:hypothetical protein